MSSMTPPGSIPPNPTPTSTPPTASARPGAKPGPIILLIVGTVLGLIGAGMLSGGTALAVATATQQNDGYFTSPARTFTVDSYAITSPKLDVGSDFGMPTGVGFDLATLRLQASAVTSGQDVFIGIAPRSNVDAYLAEVNHSELREVQTSPFRVTYRDVSGTQSPALPGDQSFWTESSSGPGTQQILWKPAAGEWSVVVMNSDGSGGVAVNVTAGVHTDLLGPIAVGLLVGGVTLFLTGALLVVLGAIGLGRQLTPRAPAMPGQPLAASGSAAPGLAAPSVSAGGDRAQRIYPAALTGHLDPVLSRGLWLIKWLLAIPHFVLIACLWFAFVVTTIVAAFAILFTGRYPRSIFYFNVGVLRWSWRVSYYAYSALGTDRYPPFTLARTDYPADFDVEYPEHLSRGLVLVKSWLLAIPHLVLLTVFVGGMSTWAYPWRDDVGFGDSASGNTGFGSTDGVSLLAVLVVVAGVILLFTGRYQRPLFDFIMGVNRWVFRVVTYTALMRDEYPPFRLDQGATEPTGEAVAHSGAAQPTATPAP
ncbi:DUF4389 domain-containing protein [Cryobacterium sp. PH29-G1]|uniref:DUF4389 domain-containing protein n=1 Tax=Cryobacterium sp. PH29-G1 TaxID=3046211 RepID=UPI0024BAF9E0|nr:DUF4389 domain-containing protein [Cryobacterium sp. PH29-G1]MDJ0347876.1 DUF4389 domain-containing protein [Cryobacterium sp. PH29-G1]